jgi:hypothetical protein
MFLLLFFGLLEGVLKGKSGLVAVNGGGNAINDGERCDQSPQPRGIPAIASSRLVATGAL